MPVTDTNTARMAAELKATDDAVRAKGWVAPGLGVPGAPLGLLGSGLDPLSGLAAAGLSWFTPLVSFLGEGLTQLQGGDAASVASGSQDFGDAGRDIAGVAGTYRDDVEAQTSGWTGTAASEYREAAAQHADGVAGLGQASNTTAGAIIGAGQVVAQCIAEVTELIAEAVAQIVPIMTQAVARAGETFGESVVEAIPPCVGIAVEYALRIAAKLAALLASGENLMKLVQGGMAVVDLIGTAMTSISGQSVQPGAERQAVTGAEATPPGTPMAGLDPRDNTVTGSPASPVGGAGGPGSGGRGGFGGGPAAADDLSVRDGAAPGGLVPSPGSATRTSGLVPAPPAVVPDANPVPAGSAPHGGGPAGAAALVPGGGVGTGRGAGTARQAGRQQPGRTSSGGGGLPLCAMGTGRPAGDKDREHQRKYTVTEQHDEYFVTAPPVIG
jgi:hypothetical protein